MYSGVILFWRRVWDRQEEIYHALSVLRTVIIFIQTELLIMAQPPSQYRINKFNAFFSFIDLNKDGYMYLSKCDHELAAVNMARLQNASEERVEKLRAEYTYWWGVVSRGKQSQKITVEDFVESCIAYCLTTDVRVTKENTRKTHSQLFDMVDANGDGLITREELKIFYNCFGFTDNDSISRVFDRIDTNKNGVISRDEFAKAGELFWTSDDPENGCEYFFNPLILKSGQK